MPSPPIRCVRAMTAGLAGTVRCSRARRPSSSAPPACIRSAFEAIGFCFDNETPRHQVYLHPYAIASRLVRNRDWLDFIEDNGYQTPSLWMSDGWATAQEAGWTAPLHWRDVDGAWFQAGPAASCRWCRTRRCATSAGMRRMRSRAGATRACPPKWSGRPPAPIRAILETTGHVWQWTESAYRPYPGYRAAPGAIGEYNGKFMINQMVLRGGSLATPARPHAPDLPEFLSPRQAMAVQRPSSGKRPITGG